MFLFKISTFIVLLIYIQNIFFYQAEYEVSLKVLNVNKEGKLRIAFFDNAESFQKEMDGETNVQYFRKLVIDAIIPETNCKISLPKGQYAIAFFLDVNGNRKIDKNFVGYPKEPFGFSNNPRTLFGPPSFEDVLIEVTGESEIILELNN